MKGRIVFLDYLRVMACFMVIMVHSCEFFFIDGSEIGIRSMSDGFWVSVIDSAFRCSVPLFVMISGYLLVPVDTPVRKFFSRRLMRVVVPFVIWSVLYATLPYLWGDMSGDDVVASMLRLAYNFNDAAGHLWFVYMIIGVYLFMPVISPWIQKVSRRGQEFYLTLWGLSTLFPYIREACGDIYGECYWNEFNILWYFSGFMGYIVLANYVRRYVDWSVRRSLLTGGVLYVAGYIFTAMVWYGRIPMAATLQQLELSWRFCTPNVVMMSFGVFVIVQSLYRNARENVAVSCISRLSYGVYLMHILVLGAVYRLLEGMMPTLWTILCVGVLTFVVCVVIARMLEWLPRSRYLLG